MNQSATAKSAAAAAVTSEVCGRIALPWLRTGNRKRGAGCCSDSSEQLSIQAQPPSSVCPPLSCSTLTVNKPFKEAIR